MQNLETTDGVREYVETELSRLPNKFPDLGVQYHWKRSDASNMLRWTIHGPTGDYRLDALMREREFVIWFGHSTGGALCAHHIMRPAVHVSFADLVFSTGHLPPMAANLTLGAVVEWMAQSLEGTENQNHYGRFDYPMNEMLLT